jgi:protein-S-isoprenylcysteine O-methyltransferase Ste14
VQLFSVVFGKIVWSFPAFPTMCEDGLILMLLGVIAFLLALVTMKTNWRAGFSEGQNTSLVTVGVYKYSRNPAFLGFDLLYIGCALCFPNVLNIAFAALAIVLFHLQILGEEVFLAKTFGTAYKDYKATTMRYFGRRLTRR